MYTSRYIPLRPIAGRYIVKFKATANASMDAAADVVTRDKGQVRHRYRGAFRGMAFELPEGTEAVRQNLLRNIKARTDVEYVVPDYEVRAYGSAGRQRDCHMPRKHSPGAACHMPRKHSPGAACHMCRCTCSACTCHCAQHPPGEIHDSQCVRVPCPCLMHTVMRR
jgi:hypothetical protein